MNGRFKRQSATTKKNNIELFRKNKEMKETSEHTQEDGLGLSLRGKGSIVLKRKRTRPAKYNNDIPPNLDVELAEFDVNQSKMTLDNIFGGSTHTNGSCAVEYSQNDFCSKFEPAPSKLQISTAANQKHVFVEVYGLDKPKVIPRNNDKFGMQVK